MRKEKKKVEESTLEENKHHRIFNRIRIKLFINLLLELLGVFSIVTSLMIIQKRVACNSQNSNSELKIKEVAERMINNELDKEKVIAKFDEFYLSKAEVLGDYFASNSDKLEEVFLNPNTTGREVLKEISSPSKYNMDGIILFRTIGDSYSANFYSRNYEDMTIADVGLDTSVISPYITENNKLRDVFIPFTYNHSAKGNEPKIIDNYTVIYSNDALISRYYGCKISDSTFALVGQEPSSLFKEILRLVSLNAILSDITVGKEGFMLALDNNYMFSYLGGLFKPYDYVMYSVYNDSGSKYDFELIKNLYKLLILYPL